MNPSPVFIFGCSRSGTTLLGDLLGAHLCCMVTPEAHFVINDYKSFLCDSRSDALERAWARILQDRRYKIWGLGPSGKDFATASLKTYADLVFFLVRRYAESVSKPHFSHWVDHTPMNIKYAASLSHLFPDARFIHLVRDGRAVMASLLDLDWGHNTVSACADLWSTRVGYGLAAESLLGSGRVLRIRYEDLVEKPEAILNQVCGFLELDYQEAMVAGKGLKVPIYTAGQHALVGQAPDRTRASAWQQKLKPRQIEIFENQTCDYLEYLGYQPIFGLKAKKVSRLEYYAELGRQLFYSLLLNPYRRRKRMSKA